METPVPMAAAADRLLLAERGTSDYRIVIPTDPSPSERHAAQELQSFLEQICGARLPIVTDQEPLGQHEIILGHNAHLQAVGVEMDLAALGDEGFLIRTVPPHLAIVGGRRRGTLYGVYAFLEEHLGCRWFTATVNHIPRLPKLELGAIDDRQQPALEYREVFFHQARDGDWSARNRLNSSLAHLGEQHGGQVAYHPFVRPKPTSPPTRNGSRWWMASAPWWGATGEPSSA